jgi:hypothetical protein
VQGTSQAAVLIGREIDGDRGPCRRRKREGHHRAGWGGFKTSMSPWRWTIPWVSTAYSGDPTQPGWRVNACQVNAGSRFALTAAGTGPNVDSLICFSVTVSGCSFLPLIVWFLIEATLIRWRQRALVPASDDGRALLPPCPDRFR